MKIGVITGMKEELEGLRRHMAVLPQDVPFYSFLSKFDNHTLVGAWAGCGKVAASMCATMLIEKYGVSILVVSGTAGLIVPQMFAPVYAISHAVQHDYGSKSKLEYTHLYRPGSVPCPPSQDNEFVADPFLVDQVLKVGHDLGVQQARCATGDVFAACDAVTQSIRLSTLCNLVDMETAAVAQVAQTYDVSWVGIKAASDEGNADDFKANLEDAARRSTVLTERLIESL